MNQVLVTNLFELSKLQSRQVMLNKEPFSIGELLNDVAKEIPVVEADVLMIDRVLQNLIDNAIRFCGEVNINIADRGTGIAHEHLPHIFDRYFRKDERGGSSGLGLAIVKRIIDLHESSIDEKSTVAKGICD